MHSGRTGRYGEMFAPLEDTLTWGKGIPLDEQAAALESTQAFDPFKDESAATAAVADTSVSSAAEPPAPPEPARTAGTAGQRAVRCRAVRRRAVRRRPNIRRSTR